MMPIYVVFHCVVDLPWLTVDDSVTAVRVHSLAFIGTPPTLDQFAVRVPRSESSESRHALLDSLGLQAFCLTRGPGDMTAPAISHWAGSAMCCEMNF